MPDYEQATAAPGERRTRSTTKHAAVGSLWTRDTMGRVHVTRPDGTTGILLHRNGVVAYVLDAPGVYDFDGERVVAQ